MLETAAWVVRHHLQMTWNEKVIARLHRFRNQQVSVRVSRSPKHADRRDGFVVGIGSKWALLAVTSDGGYPNGYEAIRVREITKVRRDRTFETAFARTLPSWPPKPPGTVDLDSTRGAISSLAKLAPLVGIEQEHRAHATWIGAVHDMHSGFVWLHEVHPDASWYQEPLGNKFKHVTKIIINNRYQTALAAVAGDRPALPSRFDSH